MEYKIERDFGEVTVWNEAAAVGIRFTEGETLQLYMCAIVLPPWKELSPRDLERIQRVANEITDYCREKWPREFAPISS